MADVAVNEGLLGRRVGKAATIVRCVYPPMDSKEDCPRCGQDVVRKEEVGKVERAFRILLRVWSK